MTYYCDWILHTGEPCGLPAVACIDSTDTAVNGYCCETHRNNHLLWAADNSTATLTFTHISAVDAGEAYCNAAIPDLIGGDVVE